MEAEEHQKSRSIYMVGTMGMVGLQVAAAAMLVLIMYSTLLSSTYAAGSCLL